MNDAVPAPESGRRSLPTAPPLSLLALVQELLLQQREFVQQQRELIGLIQQLIDQQVAAQQLAGLDDEAGQVKTYLDGTPVR